ncbi:MAG TPA: EthD family reductase [Caldimonas sp.]|nr:EthD family reductase [Caldimonas sp.]
MAKLFAIYQQPKDPAAFDRYYFDKHLPLAKTIPGLKSYEVTRGDVMGMGGKHGVYLIAILEFASMQAIGEAMASAEGQATAADLANFADAGVDVMMAETHLV